MSRHPINEDTPTNSAPRRVDLPARHNTGRPVAENLLSAGQARSATSVAISVITDALMSMVPLHNPAP